MDRRTFFLAGGTALAAQGAPSDSIVLGVIGCGGRGTSVMSVFRKQPGVRVGALCDVYEPHLQKALAEASQPAGSPAPKIYRDYRRLLEDKEVQAVLIATPEHWHHRMALDALAAGKDLYLEKPLCQTPEQGVELVQAEARSRNIVQVGMQRRSYDLFLEAKAQVNSGVLGKVRMTRSWWLNNYLHESGTARLEGPLDWEQWQGPARRHPLDPYRFFQWRYFSDYAGGIVADQGAHVFDGIHLLMNAGFPLAVNASAGRPHKAGGVDMPESVVVVAEYPEDFIAVFTINYAAMKYQARNDQLNQLDGDLARLDIGRESFAIYRQGAEESAAATRTTAAGFGKATELHVANFLDCVRTRRPTTAPMKLGFQAVLVVQLANRSLQLGRRVRWDAQRNQAE